MEDIRHYILFPSYNNGLQLESKLKVRGIKYTIVPTPRELSSCCGISIMYNKEDEVVISEIIKEEGISVTGFFSLKKQYKNPYA